MRRNLLAGFAFATAIYVVLEGVSFAGLQVLGKFRGLYYSPRGSTLAPEARANLDVFLARRGGTRSAMDSVLGWSHRAGAAGLVEPTSLTH